MSARKWAGTSLGWIKDYPVSEPLLARVTSPRLSGFQALHFPSPNMHIHTQT